MASRRRAPFGQALASTKEKPPLLEIGHRTPSVGDVLGKATDAGERWAGRFSPRVQAQLMLGAGLLLTALAWAMLPYAPTLLATKQKALTYLGFSPLALGPALLAYGGLRMLAGQPPPPPTGSKFGGVLAEAEAEERWKHRLLAIGFTIVHGMVYFAMT